MIRVTSLMWQWVSATLVDYFNPESKREGADLPATGARRHGTKARDSELVPGRILIALSAAFFRSQPRHRRFYSGHAETTRQSRHRHWCRAWHGPRDFANLRRGGRDCFHVPNGPGGRRS